MISLLQKFKHLITSTHKQHSIICDQDDLLSYDEFVLSTEEEKYIIIRAENDLNVRIIFEKEVRNSNNKYLIIAPRDYKPLPDIELLVHFISLTIKDLFPNLDAEVIKGLSFSNLSLLFNIKTYDELGREQTTKYVLENIYNLDFDTLTKVKAKERILNALIVVFLGKNNVNSAISKYLTELARPYFPSLCNSVIDKNKLSHYLINAWSQYVIEKNNEIDFEDPLLNKNIGFLFLFENIQPIKISQNRFEEIPKSLRIGVFVDENENNDDELKKLTQYLEEKIQSIEDSYEDWFTLIQIFSKTKLRQLQSQNQELIDNFAKVEEISNNRFQQFINNTYWSLYSLSGSKKPVVVSRILEYIKMQPHKKKALIVLDGMNYWQSILLIKELHKNGIEVNSKTTLAYIPSITAWSRQAIFRGNKPILSEDNSKEDSLFTSFWEQYNYTRSQIEFMKVGLYKDLNPKEVNSNTEILGIVCNDLDDIMHGITMGNKELKSSTEQWIKESRIVDGIDFLRINGYYVYITTDHGNICATGTKNLKINDKVGTPSRSKRHLLFSNDVLRENFLKNNPNLSVGIKDNSLFLRNDDAFTSEGTKIITHGGSHYWEVLIPFIEIK